ncbi:glycerol-3-phosphate dehydrogenase, mitochondrial isoform X1 [Tachysurus ichikawai]
MAFRKAVKGTLIGGGALATAFGLSQFIEYRRNQEEDEEEDEEELWLNLQATRSSACLVSPQECAAFVHLLCPHLPLHLKQPEVELRGTTELRPLKHSVAKELHNVVNMRLHESVDLRKNGVRVHKQKCSVWLELTEVIISLLSGRACEHTAVAVVALVTAPLRAF